MNWNRALTALSLMSIGGGGVSTFTEALPEAWRPKVTFVAAVVVLVAQGFAAGWRKSAPSDPLPPGKIKPSVL